MRYHLRVRRFLNRPGHHAGAHVMAVVPDSSSCTKEGCDHRWCSDPELRIADCSSVISLEFDRDTASDRRNSLYKLDVLIDTLTRFRAALEVEFARDTAARQRRRTRA